MELKILVIITLTTGPMDKHGFISSYNSEDKHGFISIILGKDFHTVYEDI
jgi:hypothetical protein